MEVQCDHSPCALHEQFLFSRRYHNPTDRNSRSSCRARDHQALYWTCPVPYIFRCRVLATSAIDKPRSASPARPRIYVAILFQFSRPGPNNRIIANPPTAPDRLRRLPSGLRFSQGSCRAGIRENRPISMHRKPNMTAAVNHRSETFCILCLPGWIVHGRESLGL